jgi:hypothetical protein
MKVGYEGVVVMISSRTPEGDPNRCPICGHLIRIEPSQPFLDAPCPHCGCLLRFDSVGTAVPRDPQAVVLSIINKRFGPPPPELASAVSEFAARVVAMPISALPRLVKRALRARNIAELITES